MKKYNLLELVVNNSQQVINDPLRSPCELTDTHSLLYDSQDNESDEDYLCGMITLY
jgi:hypothetical protein